jgi:hypothetical protein
MPKMTRRTYALGWLSLAAIFALLTALLFDLPGKTKLTIQFASTIGKVTSTRRSDHGLVTVKYSVAGTDYQQSFVAPTLNIGDSVIIYYSPSNPDLADNNNPITSLENSIAITVIASLLFPTFLLLSYRFPQLRGIWHFAPRVAPRFLGPKGDRRGQTGR